jgi:nuclear GTP-binding protein
LSASLLRSSPGQPGSPPAQATNLGRRQLAAAGTADGGTGGAECLGADTLLQLLKNYARNADIKTAITVGVVGLPNVGKSSVINSLKRSRVAQVRIQQQ